jgi:thiol-disulfide isomerase/thioredoxin
MGRQPPRYRILAAMLVSLFTFGLYSTASATPNKPTINAQARTTSAIDWKNTHLLIINGDSEHRHKHNAQAAVRLGLKKGAASVSVAGLMEHELKGVKRHKANTSDIRRMLRGVKRDKVFVYITGHGEGDNSFILESKAKVKHSKFLDILEKNLGGKEVVFLSDVCFSANFVNLIMKSKSFKTVTAMSPGIRDEQTSCGMFTRPLLHALGNDLDLDGNGTASLEEAFSYGLKEYRKVKPNTLGTFRKSIPKVKSLKEVKDGVVMVTSPWCAPCRRMEPDFNRMNLLLGGKVNFYLVDQSNTGYSGTPTTLIIKNRNIEAEKSGAMGPAELRTWMSSNGIHVKKFGISVKQLQKQGKGSSIVLVFGWEDISRELGEKNAIALLIKLTKHRDVEVASRAGIVLGMATLKKPKKYLPLLLTLLENKDKRIRNGAIMAILYLRSKNWTSANTLEQK